MFKNVHILLIPLLISIVSFASNLYAQNEIQRPSANEGPTKVKMTVAVLNINEVNAAAQVVTMNVYLRVEWNDPRLVHEGPINIIKPLAEIWNPKLMIVNRQSMTPTLPEIAEIHPDGTIVYKQRVFGQFSQMLDYSDFPFDRQKFNIRIVAAGYLPDEIEFAIDTVQQSVVSSELTAMDWDIIHIDNISKPYTITAGAKSIASLSIDITADRKSVYYIFNFVVPLLLIILMSIAVFFLDPKLAAPQISLASTSMLTLIAYRFMIAGSLPKINYLTRMDVFIFYSTILIFITLAEAVLTVTLSTKNNEVLANKIDLYSRWIFPLLYFIVYAAAFLF